MTYTVATRPIGSSFQFVPVLGFILMPLRQAQQRPPNMLFTLQRRRQP